MNEQRLIDDLQRADTLCKDQSFEIQRLRNANGKHILEVAHLRKEIADLHDRLLGMEMLYARVSVQRDDLLTESDRLRSGRFTEDEFQNLCHNFNQDDCNEFCEGCLQYQIKLFGDEKVAEWHTGMMLAAFGDSIKRSKDKVKNRLEAHRKDAENEVDESLEGFPCRAGFTPDVNEDQNTLLGDKNSELSRSIMNADAEDLK